MKAERESERQRLLSSKWLRLTHTHTGNEAWWSRRLAAVYPSSSGIRVLGPVSTFCPKWLLLGRRLIQDQPRPAARESDQNPAAADLTESLLAGQKQMDQRGDVWCVASWEIRGDCMDVCINMWHVFLGTFRFLLQQRTRKINIF